MVINLNVQYNGGFLPDILLSIQALIVLSYIITTFLIMYYFVFCCVWWPGIAINVSVQYDGGSPPDIILLTQGYNHWGAHLNAMKRLCSFSL